MLRGDFGNYIRQEYYDQSSNDYNDPIEDLLSILCDGDTMRSVKLLKGRIERAKMLDEVKNNK
jgi:hypothetical protein